MSIAFLVKLIKWREDKGNREERQRGGREALLNDTQARRDHFTIAVTLVHGEVALVVQSYNRTVRQTPAGTAGEGKAVIKEHYINK